jgi:hypothetical protein
LCGLGVIVPPSDLYAAMGKRRRFAHILTSLETRLASHWPFKYLGDHYWLELERGGRCDREAAAGEEITLTFT